MKRLLAIALACTLLTGCASIFPKRVEFGQDKVEKFPVKKAAEQEVQRQAAQRAAEEAAKTLEAAIEEETSPAVIEPAKATAKLTDAVSDSLGPPLKPSAVTSAELARALDAAMAKLNKRIDGFKADNDENLGKKIEGTGWLSVPYFIWVGILAALGFVGFVILGVAWAALKVFALSNPPLALGLNAVQLGTRGATSLAGQLLKGGEKFKSRLATEISDPALQAKIQQLFRDEHEKAQSPEAQLLVKHLTS